MSELMAQGRDAELFAAGPGSVRRRYRDGRDVTAEAEVMRWLHSEGYPVPELYDAQGPDLIMTLVEGPTMAESLLSEQIEPSAAGEMLADLHNRLHALAHPEARATQCLVHLDLHPLNVLIAASGPVVIDWSNSRLGDPRLDVSMTMVILAQAATVLPPELAGIDPAYLRATLAPLLSAFSQAAEHDPAAALDQAAELRRRDPHLSTAERSGLDAAMTWASTLL